MIVVQFKKLRLVYFIVICTHVFVTPPHVGHAGRFACEQHPGSLSLSLHLSTECHCGQRSHRADLTKSTGNSGSVFHGDEVCEWAGRSLREWVWCYIHKRDRYQNFNAQMGSFKTHSTLDFLSVCSCEYYMMSSAFWYQVIYMQAKTVNLNLMCESVILECTVSVFFYKSIC